MMYIIGLEAYCQAFFLKKTYASNKTVIFRTLNIIKAAKGYFYQAL
jgi:hypothetical protein